MSLVNEQRPRVQMPRLILWIAMTQSVILYAVVVKMAARPAMPEIDPAAPDLKLIFTIISISLVVVAFILRFTVLQNKPALATSIYIVIFALAEVPGIVGLLQGLQGTPMKELYPFLGMSLLALVALSPALFQNLRRPEASNRRDGRSTGPLQTFLPQRGILESSKTAH